MLSSVSQLNSNCSNNNNNNHKQGSMQPTESDELPCCVYSTTDADSYGSKIVKTIGSNSRSSSSNIGHSNNEEEKKKQKLTMTQRVRLSDLANWKAQGQRWSMLTCYDYSTARMIECTRRVPVVLVGDSCAQVVYGYTSTVPVTMDEMVPLARAVARACHRTLVVADLPFGAYQESAEKALRAAVRFMKEAQVQAVKLEGGAHYVEHVRLLTAAGVPVFSHLGFTPQSEHLLGGYRVQGRSEAGAQRLLSDALALEEAGACACVLELVPALVARQVTRHLRIPTIGIGAGPDCDAQVLVWQDALGWNVADDRKLPKFVRQYAQLAHTFQSAVEQFADSVESGTFPSEEHSYD